MGADIGQQNGWIHLIDLTVAFVFPVPVVQTEEAKSPRVAAPQMSPASA